LRVIEPVSSRPIVASTPIVTRSQGEREGWEDCACLSLSASRELVTAGWRKTVSVKTLQWLEGQEVFAQGAHKRHDRLTLEWLQG